MAELFISVIIVKFHSMPDCVLSSQQWADVGGYRGFIKTGICSIKEIEQIEYKLMSEQEFAALTTLEG